MFGTISANTMRVVDSPVALAAWTKSRFLRVSAWARRMRASNAHRTTARTRIIVPMPRFLRYPEITISSGIAGMVRQTLMRKFTTSSTIPPAYAAVIPRIAARAVASKAAAAPSRRERRAPTTTCEKMSLPWSVVPKRWCHDGACRAARRLNSFGWATEMSGAIRAITTTKATMARPAHDFGFFSRSKSQPGRCSRRRLTRTGGGAGRSTVRSSCDIRPLGAAGRRRGCGAEGEGEEDARQKVGQDHGQREGNEEGLLERIVVSEHGRLQGEP